jgi:uncharacterized membrane protein
MKFKLSYDEKDYLKLQYVAIGVIFLVANLLLLGAWFFSKQQPFRYMPIGFYIYIWLICCIIPWIFLFIGRTKWFN